MDSTVTSDLMTPEADQPIGPGHARGLAPGLVVALVGILAAVAVAATAIRTSGNNSAPKLDTPASQVSTSAAGTSTAGPSAPSVPPTPRKTSPQSSITATPPARVPLLGNGKQAGRSEIPWSQVGPGWTLALWTPSTTIDKNAQGAVLRNSPESLLVVNPVGGRYLITTLPVGHHLQLEEWSGDGRRARFTLTIPNANLPTTTHVELNLETGARHEITVSGSANFSYTRPLGLALLVSRVSGLERVGLDGSRQLVYPTSYPGIGKVSGGYYSPDGSQLVRNTDHGWVLTRNDGTVVRTLSRPTGMAHCRNHRWWTATTILMTCYPGSTNDHPKVWLVPITGAAATPLLGPEADQGEFLDVIRVGSQTFFERSDLSGGFHCDGTDVFALLPDGRTRSLNLRKRTGTSQGVHFLQANGQTLYLTTNLRCGQNQRIVSYDPRTDALSTLLGGPVKGGSIIAALGYRATDPPR